MLFIAYINGLVLLFFAALMSLAALLYPETRDVFLESAILVGLVGAFVALAASSAPHNLHRLHTFLLTCSVWLLAAVAGAVPLYLWSMTPADALFEAMSGITTTGSTVMTGLDTTPHGIILWRALLQAVGGVGFIVTGIALLPILKVGGMQLFRTESSDKGEKELRSSVAFASVTLQVYLGLMAICALVYHSGGMTGFDAVTHAMTTLSTGGYSGHDASFGYFESAFLQWAGTAFMLFGALPFAWYIRGVYRGSLKSEQVRAMVISLTCVILAMALWLSMSKELAFWTSLRMTAFNVISVVTTTGFATTDYTTWGPFAAVIFFLLTAIGGCTGSTSGGAKAMRWLVLLRTIRAQAQSLHSPNRVVSVRYEGRRIEEDVASSVIAFFAMYFVTFGSLTLVLAFLGLDFATATSGALTALANVGPGVGPIIGPAGNFSSLSDPVKYVLIVGMYLGRLEMMTVFVLLTRAYWEDVLA